MSTDFAELEAQAMKLSPQERLRLADHLLASLTEEASEEIDAAWAEELERRMADIESGRVPTVSLEDALRSARAALR
jgi:putative addiction module component (TIGR02574 family)